MKTGYHFLITISLTLLACMGGATMFEATQEARASNGTRVYLPLVTAEGDDFARPVPTATATMPATTEPTPTATNTTMPSPTNTPSTTATAPATNTPPPSTPTATATNTPPPPTPTATNTPTPVPSPTPEEGRVPWLEVSSWAYQLSGYPNSNLNQIENSNFELVVIDLARDGYLGYFTNAEIQAVKDSDKYVLAYFEIGAIESYRPEWDQVPDDLKLGPVSGWADEQYVKYWDDRWWPIVQGRIDQAIAAGFDGAYLDMIVTYEEIPANSAGTNRTDLARKMTALIERTSEYAKAIDPDFKIVPQNSPELGVAGYLSGSYNQNDADTYLAAVDGIGMEELYYLATDNPCNQGWCQENRDNADIVGADGNLVLTVDYANQYSNVEDAYMRSRAAGFVPYASVRSLDILRINEGLDP